MLAVMGLLPRHAQVQGSIRLNGQELLGGSEKDWCRIRGARIGMVFQEPMTALNPVHTIGRQVAEPLRLHLGLDKTTARQRAIALLDRVGIPQAAQRFDAYPHQFSGGQRQRITIAMALACGPDLLIADEPTTALDVSIQAQIITLLKNICKSRGAAVMLITHDMGVIAETCDRVAVLYAGRVAEIGPVHDVINQPSHPYTAGLMASIPDMEQERERLNQIDGAMPRLNAIPRGCAFNPRCPHVNERCRTERPQLLTLGGIRIACHAVEEGRI
jgi:peptide/nickel transport system ATP-binding protein